MERSCDIVMKGGITSGVVYPLAAVRLAERYRFRNVGGTSAGAIAAAAVAAAEHGRRNDRGTSFGELADLPAWLGFNLRSLFQATIGTRPLLRIALAATGNGSAPRRALAGLVASIAAFPLWALLGILPGLLLGILAANGADGLLLIWALVCALVLVDVGLTVGLVGGIAHRALVELPKNGFGICSGWAPERPGEPPPLTTWLADLVDRLAGKEEAPLTFGDLWGQGDPGEDRDVNLEVMTTCVTQARPYRLPFETTEFWFDPGEFDLLFPPRVVGHMVRHARADERASDFAPLLPLPAPRDLPVVVAARMSLSFPILISAVPLHAIDRARPLPEALRRPERCWFSDGGIVSNFPVHFFDSPVPRWPTFAIGLRKFGRDSVQSPEECENVWMPADNEAGVAPDWTSWEALSGSRRLRAFLGSIATTMQNWSDNAQARVPGYRDRIAQISHSKKEGGLNLNMDPKVIERLSVRGQCAGDLLGRRFAVPPEDSSGLTWDNQRWIRYRSFMRLLEGALGGLRRGYVEHHPEDPSLDDLSRGRPDPPDYRWISDAQGEGALAGTEALVEFAARLEERGGLFAHGAPEPAPDLRVTPHI